MRRYFILALVVVLTIGAVGPALAVTEGSPSLSVHLPDNRVTPGEETSLGLFLLNGGNVTKGGTREDEARVTTARNVTVKVNSGNAPIEVKTARQPIGNVPEGRFGPIQFSVSVDEDATPGKYAVPVRVSYNYTSRTDSTDPTFNPKSEERTLKRTVTLVVEDHPRFAVVNASSDAYVGEAGDVTVALRNVGTATASDATVTLESQAPALSFGGTGSAQVFAGDWAPGEVRKVTVSGRIAADAGGSDLPLSATVSFEDDDGVTRQSEAMRTGVSPIAGNSRFPVVNASADVAVGERGTIELHVRNAGGSAVQGATVTVRSTDPALTFGGSPSGAVFAGTWEPGEVRTFELSATVAGEGDARPYPVSVTVDYQTAFGEARQSSPARTGITPRTEQSFGLANVSSTLAVGDEGTFRGSVTNTGEAPVRNAVVVFTADNANVVPVETEYAIGNLAPGESATFSFDAEVTDSADAGPRQLSLVVRYRDADDDVRRSDPLDARVEVGARADVFDIEPVAATFSPGETGVLELRVTNDGSQTVSDVSAKLFADDPLSSADDEAFIDELGPGESTTVKFTLGVAGGAVERKVYPVSMDFQYEDAEGDTRLSDSYDVPIQVTASEDSGSLPLTLIGGAVIVVIAVIGGVWYWRNR